VPTIGVSIAIPAPHGDVLQAKRASYGDPLADSIPTHVTLLPPTLVADADMDMALTHLDRVSRRTPAFPMVLRGTGTFRPVSPVVFVQVSRGIAECELLEQAVRTGPLERKLEFYYHPHVTVAHDVPDESLDRAFSDLADFEASFDVEAFHLYEHGADAVWRPVQTFPLQGR
jgi:2'-5' RNA ligase